jgi:outer membrane lipase/esterase
MSLQQGMLAPDEVQALALRAGVLAAAQVRRLADAGAGQVLAANVADFGRVPAFGSGEGPASGLATQLSTSFNAVFAEHLRPLAPRVQLLDAFATFGDMLDHPARHGLTNVRDQAFNPAITPMSATGSAPNGLAAHLVAPDAGQTYLFADFVHPTEAGHRRFGQVALQALLQHRPT